MSTQTQIAVMSSGRPSEKVGTASEQSDRSICIVGAYPNNARGSRGVSEDLCDQLSAAGWKTRIVSRRTSRAGRVFDMMWACWNERKNYQVVAVDLYSGAAFYWALAVCWILRRAGKPYILMLHGGNLPKFADSKPHLVSKLLASARAVITPSGYLAQQMREYYEGIQVFPNALMLRRYACRVRDQIAPRLVWLRAFHRVYNPELAIQTLAILRREIPDIQLTMIGPDKGDGSLEKARQQAQRLGVTGNLTLMGSVPKVDVPAKLAEADIFLNTSRVDNTPVSVLEAMACGMCIVSSDVGGIPHLLQSEHDALLVPTDDPEEMARAVRRIVTDINLARRLSLNARKSAEQFDWSVVTPRWEALLESVIYSNVKARETFSHL
jgi:glycosyltransferase involved in cell wall biosynthesis